MAAYHIKKVVLTSVDLPDIISDDATEGQVTMSLLSCEVRCRPNRKDVARNDPKDDGPLKDGVKAVQDLRELLRRSVASQ